MFARVSKKTEGFFSTFYEKKLAISLNKKMSSSAICSCTINLLYIHVIIICLSILSTAKAAAEGLQSNVWTRLFCISHVYLHYLSHVCLMKSVSQIIIRTVWKINYVQDVSFQLLYTELKRTMLIAKSTIVNIAWGENFLINIQCMKRKKNLNFEPTTSKIATSPILPPLSLSISLSIICISNSFWHFFL